jgi:hypothetical protein
MAALFPSNSRPLFLGLSEKQRIREFTEFAMFGAMGAVSVPVPRMRVWKEGDMFGVVMFSAPCPDAIIPLQSG